MCPASPQLSRLPGPAGKTVGPSALAELALSCPDSSGLCLHTASPCSSRCSRLVLPPAPPLSPPSDLLWCGLEQGLQENDLFSNRCIHEKKISHTLTCIFFLTRSCGSVFRREGRAKGHHSPAPGARDKRGGSEGPSPGGEPSPERGAGAGQRGGRVGLLLLELQCSPRRGAALWSTGTPRGPFRKSPGTVADGRERRFGMPPPLPSDAAFPLRWTPLWEHL